MIVGLIEHDRGKLNERTLGMLAFGRNLASRLGVPLEALVIGDAGRPLAAGLGAHGVVTVHLAQHEWLTDYAPEAWAQCIVALMAATSPLAVLAAGTDRCHEVMAHVAARTNLPLASNCIDVRTGEPFTVTRLRWGGSVLEEAHLRGYVKLLTVAPEAVRAEERAAFSEPAVTLFTPELAAKDFRVRIAGRVEAAENEVSLSDATLVVGGGRGVGSAEGFKILEELAGLLGGAVGCSRAVTSLGWRAHHDQIGQTGTRIAPDLYIACGVSGAVQHMVGCRAAKRILAINTDAEAPVVARADYAIIGDLHKVVPALSAAVRKAKG